MEVKEMEKITFAVKLNPNVLNRVKKFCLQHGIKYGFFVEKALQEQLEREELKEDILELKTLREQERFAIPLKKYLKSRN